MVIRRANFWCNLIFGIGSATLGLILLLKVFSGSGDWLSYLLLILGALVFGFNQIQEATQSLEISESALIYQSARKIVHLRWDEIGGYVLNDERFVAFDQQSKILLDIGLRGNDYLAWPVQECAQTRNFIQQKMNEVGAARISSLSLCKDHGFQFKP